MTTQLTDATPGAGAPGAGPSGTGSQGTRILGLLALVAVALLVFLAFVASAPDVEMGDTVRLMYVHVPVVTVAYLGIMLATVGSVMVLWKRSQWWDLVAASSVEICTVLTGLTLVTGMLWGRPTWGVFWVWDARLTSTAVLFLLELGYMAVRRTTYDQRVRATRSAIVGLLLLPNVVIVNRSVEWWRSLHQSSTLVRLNPEIDGLQLFTLMFGMVTMTLVALWLLIHRFRVAWLQDQVDDLGLQDAIAERRAEVTP